MGLAQGEIDLRGGRDERLGERGGGDERLDDRGGADDRVAVDTVDALSRTPLATPASLGSAGQAEGRPGMLGARDIRATVGAALAARVLFFFLRDIGMEGPRG